MSTTPMPMLVILKKLIFQKKMDAEIHAMLSDAYKKSFEVVSQYKTEVEFLAEALIEKQVNYEGLALTVLTMI